jgi:HEAT repeat protein
MNDDMASLIEEALAQEHAEPDRTDDGHDWPAAEQMGRSPNALAAARTLAQAPDPAARAAAAHALGVAMNGNDDRTQVAEAVRLLAEMLHESHDLHLDWSIADALRLAWHPEAISPLVSLERSESPRIRRSVAEGLSGAMSDHVVPAGIEALIRLSLDPESEVRNWATFSLAQMDHDAPEVRSALWARTDDPDYDTRSEALLGLAELHDRRVAERIATELRSGRVGKLVVEAAARLAEPDLLQPLLALRSWWDIDSELLDRAIGASRRA